MPLKLKITLFAIIASSITSALMGLIVIAAEIGARH